MMSFTGAKMKGNRFVATTLQPGGELRKLTLCCGWADHSRAGFSLVNQKWVIISFVRKPGLCEFLENVNF